VTRRRVAGALLALSFFGCCCPDESRPAEDLKGVPPVIDEVEAFERRVERAMPPSWTLERLDLRPTRPARSAGSRPWADPYHRAWLLSTPWPGTNQRVQVMLFLAEKETAPPTHLERLTEWERFIVVADDPAAMVIAGVSHGWDDLPDWPDARLALTAALR
jgi:hypothetical protein